MDLRNMWIALRISLGAFRHASRAAKPIQGAIVCVNNQYLMATQGGMFCDLPRRLPWGSLYLAAPQLHPKRLLHKVASLDHSSRQAHSRLDLAMCYLWATSQPRRSMLLRSGKQI